MNSFHPVFLLRVINRMNLLRIVFLVFAAVATALQSFAQISLVDDLGRNVSLATPAKRIVSLAPSMTETLFAIGAGGQIAGVTDYCNYPGEATRKQRVGGVINPSIETIVSLKPDLIVLSMEGNVRDDFTKLTEFGIPVMVSNPRNLDGIYRSISQLGMLTGRTGQAETLVTSLRTRANAVTRKASSLPKRSLLMFVSLEPIIVAGSGTFIAELIALAGGRNTAVHAPSTYPLYSREAVLKDNPDLLIFLADVLSSPAGLAGKYPEWLSLKALRSNQVHTINADIVSRPGPRAVEALETLFTLIHNTH